jgi:ABC-2 type transport system ATP-binding protein
VCNENGWNILMLQLSDLTLEDIFLKITVGEGLVIKKEEENADSEAEKQETEETAEAVETAETEEAEEASDESKKDGGKK